MLVSGNLNTFARNVEHILYKRYMATTKKKLLKRHASDGMSPMVLINMTRVRGMTKKYKFKVNDIVRAHPEFCPHTPVICRIIAIPDKRRIICPECYVIKELEV